MIAPSTIAKVDTGGEEATIVWAQRRISWVLCRRPAVLDWDRRVTVTVALGFSAVADETVDAQLGVCRLCQGSPADSWLDDDGPLCDLCFDARVSASTGWPRLPVVPDPVEIVGPDGRRHLTRYRISRVPTGISLRLREDHVPPGEGYEFAVLGDHDADVAELIAAVLGEARAEIGRSYLEPGPTGGWQVAGEEVAGRLEFDEETGSGGPYRVVVDGRPLSWEQLGETLSGFDGWRMRILLDDRCLDLRSADHESPSV